jgi:hypothetical protein
MATLHRVRAGECISSIAVDHGFFPATIWEHENNAALRELRDPNVLHPGDEVFIPDRELREQQGQTDTRHSFVRRGVPAKFRMQLCNGLDPRPNLGFTLVVDGWKTVEGQTDDQGVLEVELPPKAQRGVLTIGEGEQVVHLRFGQLAPVEEDAGVDQRLFNLGLLRRATPSPGDRRAALRMFQRHFELTVSGEADGATRAKLAEIHDSRETGKG